MVPTKIPIKVQKRSGFEKSHHNALSQKVGVITPLMVDEIIPNSKVNLRYALAGSLPPLATDTYMKCYFDIRAFFVPLRLLSGSFNSWFSDYEYNYLSGGSVISAKAFMPYLSIDPQVDFAGIFGPQTLSDYLGYKCPDISDLVNLDGPIEISVLPYLAYHKICADWFRQPNITKDFFARPAFVGASGSNDHAVSFCPFSAFITSSDAVLPVVNDRYDANIVFTDGISVFDLRSANYDYDYFTNGLPSAQLGNPITVQSVNDFSIASLRVGNALQEFAEINQLAGPNEVSVVRARYGAKLHDSITQRSLYLGGARLDFGTKSVDIRVNAGSVSSNPFSGTAGASAGKAFVQGTDVIIDGFTANEPGYIFVVGVIIPKVTYGSGIRRYLRHYIKAGSITDMANPMLQGVGNQPIYDYELTSSLGFNHQEQPFGYTDRYAEFMTMEEVSS